MKRQMLIDWNWTNNRLPLSTEMASTDSEGSGAKLVPDSPSTQELTTHAGSNQQQPSNTFVKSNLPPTMTSDEENLSAATLVNSQFIPERMGTMMTVLNQDQLNISNKRIKIDSGNGLLSDSRQLLNNLNEFKSTLMSSFDRNFQKLEVLDRLVQTVSLKENLKFERVRGALAMLDALKVGFVLLREEQRANLTSFRAELQNSLLPMILEALKGTSSSKVTNSTIVADIVEENDCLRRELAALQAVKSGDQSMKELAKQLKLEEESHLTDLAILSSRNKELSREQRHLKKELECSMGQLCEAEAFRVQDRQRHEDFLKTSGTLIGVQVKASQEALETSILQAIENQKDWQLSLETLKTQLRLLEYLKANSTVPENSDLSSSMEAINELLSFISKNFTNFLEVQDSRRESLVEEVSSAFSSLSRGQDALARQALQCKITLQGRLADAQSTCKQLQGLCDQLRSEIGELYAYKQRSSTELQGKVDHFQQKLRDCEMELSERNQLSRAQEIRIQQLQQELEDSRSQNRHDIAVLERKLSLLEPQKSRSSTVHDDFIPGTFERLSRNRTLESEETSATIMASSDVPRAASKAVLATFTGIRDGQKQKSLAENIERLGGSVHVGTDFTDEITHVIAPRGYRSIRVLAASLTAKWIVPLEWIEASVQEGRFVNEHSVSGYCNQSIRPFRFRSLWMSRAFSSSHQSHPTYPTAALRTLLEKLGRVRWCDALDQAELLLVTEDEKQSRTYDRLRKSEASILTLTDLIHLIPIE